MKLMSSQELLKLPQPGETWAIDDGSPWPSRYKCRIIDVKDGWVRYYLTPKYCDERIEIEKFVKIFKFYQKSDCEIISDFKEAILKLESYIQKTLISKQ